jgi:hypothetical protein
MVRNDSKQTNDPGRGAPGAVKVCVRDGPTPFESGFLSLYRADGIKECCEFVAGQWMGSQDDCELVADNRGVLEDGCYVFSALVPGVYIASFDHDVREQDRVQCVEVHSGCTAEVCFDIRIGAKVKMSVIDGDCRALDCTQAQVGRLMRANIATTGAVGKDWAYAPPHGWKKTDNLSAQFRVTEAGAYRANGTLGISSTRAGGSDALLPMRHEFDAEEPRALPVTGNLTVSHQRRIAEPDGPLSFFVRLLDASKSIGFGFYHDFIDQVFGCTKGGGPDRGKPCYDKLAGQNSKLNRLKGEITDHGVGAYELLRTATEAFLLFRCCVRPCGEDGSWPLNYNANPDLGDYRKHASDEWRELFCKYLGNQRLPYIQRVIDTALPEYEDKGTLDQRFCADVLLRSRVDNPCFLELIWNYWHEEGMLVQSINAVSRRFQNLRAPGERDPLAHMEIDPLRPLNNILWGYVEDERDRLSIKRRAYEYHHQYGLSLYGKAVTDLRPADTRSKFIEAFHNLLNKCADYYRAKQDTTVDPDGYPILHAIQELNLILAQGAHNQFGDLAWTARVEMLMQEWVMARPEMRDFLQSRAMVPYKEAWMPQVDTMKTMQGWTDVVVTHFRDLGVFGEQIMLTIRWYNWYDVTSEEEAKGWADLLRAQIQTYIHAYRAVTGVDLSTMDGVDYTMPSVHLRKRLALQQRAR